MDDKYFDISVLYKNSEMNPELTQGATKAEREKYNETFEETWKLLNTLAKEDGAWGESFADIFAWYGEHYVDIVRINNMLPLSDRIPEEVTFPLNNWISACVTGELDVPDKLNASSLLQIKHEDKTQVLRLKLSSRVEPSFSVDYFKTDDFTYRAVPEFGGLRTLPLGSLEAIRKDLRVIHGYRNTIAQQMVEHQNRFNVFLNGIGR